MNQSRRKLLGSSLAVPVLAACGSGETEVTNTALSTDSLSGSANDLSALAQMGGVQEKSFTTYTKSAVLLWNEVVIDAVRSGTIGPPMVARALAIIHTAMYDAWAPFDRIAVASLPGATQRFARSTTAETLRRKEIAISYAAYRTLLDLYPAQKSKFDAQMQLRNLDINDLSLSADTPSGVGNAAAAVLLASRRNDGSNQLGELNPGAYSDYTGYLPVNSPIALNNPNRWQPLTYSTGATPKFLVPHWGSVRPFAIGSGASMRPTISLPQFGSAEYADQAQEIVQLTANLTDQEKVVAEYWSNGPKTETPPGHWFLFANDVSQRYRFSLDADVRMYMALGNAMLDASIGCWDCKRAFDSARPITAIRALYANQTIQGFRGPGLGIGAMLGSQWSPFQPSSFITPPFAEFTSGHSTFSSAGAAILSFFVGSDRFANSDTITAGALTTEPGLPAQSVTLNWPTFSAAAREAGRSRMLGGIHFRMGNEYGLSMGQRIAPQVALKALGLFLGRRF
jgi:PAP2 superfamily